MPLRAGQLFLAVAIIVFVGVFLVAPPSTFGQTPPSGTALGAFEALRSAASSGANVTALVDQYNALLQQSSKNNSFTSLQQMAQNAQQKAVSEASSDRTLTIVLVPTLALVLALAMEGLLQLRRRLERKRMLEMEIGRK